MRSNIVFLSLLSMIIINSAYALKSQDFLTYGEITYKDTCQTIYQKLGPPQDDYYGESKIELTYKGILFTCRKSDMQFTGYEIQSDSPVPNSLGARSEIFGKSRFQIKMMLAAQPEESQNFFTYEIASNFNRFGKLYIFFDANGKAYNYSVEYDLAGLAAEERRVQLEQERWKLTQELNQAINLISQNYYQNSGNSSEYEQADIINSCHLEITKKDSTETLKATLNFRVIKQDFYLDYVSVRNNGEVVVLVKIDDTSTGFPLPNTPSYSSSTLALRFTLIYKDGEQPTLAKQVVSLANRLRQLCQQ